MSLISGFRTASLGTLVGRLAGLARDVATAMLLGASSSPAMDALAVALRLPELFRRLFVEGALSASYLPEAAAAHQRSPDEGRRLAGATLLRLTTLLALAVVAGEAALRGLMAAAGDSPTTLLLLRLNAVLLPMLMMICLTAHLAATLHAVGHFAVPSLTPALLNVIWLVAALFVAPRVSADHTVQATVVALAIVGAGVLQFALQWTALAALRLTPILHWSRDAGRIRRIAWGALPAMWGLSATHMNSFVDSYLAWSLTGEAGARMPTWGLFDAAYPLTQGAASTLHYAERLYMFPLGVVGLAVATAIYPLLSRHAARGDVPSVAADLVAGLRLVLALAVPAGVGLMALALPITLLLFRHGEFGGDDATRTAQVVLVFGVGVWSICALPVLVRACYALDDRRWPVLLATLSVALNIVLDAVLVWPLAETGLALATIVCTSLQTALLLVCFHLWRHRLDWRGLGVTVARAAAASGAMLLAVWLVAPLVPAGEALSLRLAAVVAPLTCAAVAYVAVFLLLGGRELTQLLKRRA
ncbi:MAG: murein biosynthesis integral membrane protein MurJ [Planctomycetales bacterium]|nr:murein biosynthesis integral membrane protein MurJ [Planctomycetales bacterium]